MAYRRRIFFTDRQKSEIWDRWQRGESMSSIGRSFNRNSSSIHPLIARAGGFRPAERKRSKSALTLAEREEISRGLGVGASLRQIACGLRRAPSTISREVHRNGGREGWLRSAGHGACPRSARRVERHRRRARSAAGRQEFISCSPKAASTSGRPATWPSRSKSAASWLEAKPTEKEPARSPNPGAPIAAPRRSLLGPTGTWCQSELRMSANHNIPGITGASRAAQ